MNSTEINDVRTPADFKSVSFSSFKKTEVKKQLLENLKNSRVEQACYWTAELVCAGHYDDIWEIMMHYMSKYVHMGNPMLAVYLEKRWDLFDTIVKQKHHYCELQLRNYESIRRLFAEITCVLALSHKKHSFEHIKINRTEEFDMSQMTERLKAPDTSYVEEVFMTKDPKELIIPLNEFSFHLSHNSRNATHACYWIEWLLEFETLCKKQKEPLQCEKRNYKVENKLRGDLTWLIWDVLWVHCNDKNNDCVTAVMNSLCNLFCVNYTTSIPKKRRYMLYFAVSLLIEPLPETRTEIFSDKETIQQVVDNIDQIYEQIKCNEISPNVDYLFDGLNENATTFEETVRKMEAMNRIDGLFM